MIDKIVTSVEQLEKVFPEEGEGHYDSLLYLIEEGFLDYVSSARKYAMEHDFSLDKLRTALSIGREKQYFIPSRCF